MQASVYIDSALVHTCSSGHIVYDSRWSVSVRDCTCSDVKKVSIHLCTTQRHSLAAVVVGHQDERSFFLLFTSTKILSSEQWNLVS